MSAVRARNGHKLARTLGLLVSASALSIILSGEAQAQSCTVSSGDPLNNITTPVSAVNCTGANTGQTIVVNTNGVEVTVTGAGTTLGNSTVTLNGDANAFSLGAGTSAPDLVYASTGNVGTFEVLGTITDLQATITGLQNNATIFSGGSVTALPGRIVLSAGAGQNQSFTVQANGSLAGTANNPGFYLITGGTGNQFININGTMTVQADGLAIDTGADDDQIFIGASASITGGTGNNILFDGGAGNDRLTLFGTGTWDVNTVNIERLDIQPGANNGRFLNGTGDYSQVFISGGGAANVTDLAALGQSNSAVSIATGSVLILSPTNPSVSNHGFTGGGIIVQVGQDTTYGGDGSGFTGLFRVSANTAIITSANAFGTGTTENNSTVSFGGLNLTNDITGTGQVVVTSNGNANSRLSGVNTFSGGLDIQGGILDVASVSSLGTGFVTSTTAGGILGVGNNTDEVLANDLIGNLALVKAGVGILDLTGTNSYTGGTLINGGAIRVDGFARLGTGPVLSNAGGSLILDYNGAAQLLQTTPFLTGAGSFIKEGSGDVVMNQTSTYTGGTIIRAGRIGLNNGDALGTGAIQIDSGAELGIGGVTVQNEISGSGSIVKTASNQATLGGDNSGFTGLIDIQDGVVVIEDGRSAGVGSVTIGGGTALVVDSAVGDTTIAATLSGAGDLEKIGPERLTLTGTNTLTGTVFVGAGTLQIAGGQNIGTADIVLSGAAGVLDLSTSGSTTLGNDILGNGRVVKTGTGTVFLTGANAYTGGTDIQQGAIRVTDTAFLGTGAITVQAGAALDLSIAATQTLSQNVSGAGILRKSDVGDLTLLGNGLTGGVDIVGGRVIVSSTAALGGGAVSTAADTQLVFTNSATEVSNTLITGAGTLTMDGTGLLVMNNANAFTGGTLINSGRIGLNDGLGLGTGNVIVLQGASLGLGNVTYANNTGGAGQIVKTSAGITTLTGTNTHSGGINIQNGILDVSGNSALGTGTIVIGSGANLRYTNVANATFSNGLSGAGTFTKLGAGLLSFANNFTLGALNLSAGRTRINSVATTNATVASGATLDGTGRIIGNLVNNGIVAPGNSIGTLTVQGNYTHNANSVLEIEFDANGNIDLLDVTGNATINGGTIRFVSVGGAEGQGGTFLRTGGTLTGTFATVETVGALLPLSVVYEPNRALMAPSVLTARPSTFNAQSLAAADTALAFIDSIGVGDARHGAGNRIWLEAFGASGNRSASGATLAYDHETRGVSGGVSVAVGDALTLGAAIGWAGGDITLGEGGGGGDQSSLLGSVTARYSGAGLTLGGGVVYGQVDQDTLRNVSFNGFADSVAGETDSRIFGAFADLGLPLGTAAGWTFGANARGSYISQRQDGYTESGTSPLRLTLDDLTNNTFEGQARLSATTQLWGPSTVGGETVEGLDLRIDLGGRYLGNLGDREIPVTFAVSDAGVVLQGDTRDALHALVGAGLDYTIRGGATFSLGYRGDIGQTDRHAVHLGVNIGF